MYIQTNPDKEKMASTQILYTGKSIITPTGIHTHLYSNPYRFIRCCVTLNNKLYQELVPVT